MQQLLAKFGEKAELNKTLKKGHDGKRSGGSSSFKGSARNNNYSDYRSGSGSSNRSRGAFHPRNGRGRGGFNNYRRGGGGNRNYSDKDRSSSFKAKDKSSSSSSSSKDKSAF